jgi:hypothetical protein
MKPVPTFIAVAGTDHLVTILREQYTQQFS